MSNYVWQVIRSWEKKQNKKYYYFSFALALLFAGSCGIFTSASAASSTSVYVDAKLGFSLQVPNAWNAHAYPGTESSATTSGVTFSLASSLQDQIGISVIRDTGNPQGFAQRGTPTLHIGNYAAFKYDTSKQAQYPLACLVRVMLSGNDLVSATWCSPQTASASQTSQFESVLATYASQSSVSSNALHANTVNPVESCQDVINANGMAYQGGDWGIQQGNPTDSQWTTTFNPGAAVCDNFINGSTPYSGYLFQCVELANRFAREQWGITPGFTVNAANYYDYYEGGTFYQGQARTLYGNNVQLSSDASQGTSSFAPVPGDLLVWQSVNNPSVGWTSGLTSGPGHVAVITNVDASHVSIAQQNYSEPQYYATLTLTKVSNGWTITGEPFYDSGVITRGWIHFNANPHTIGSSSTPPSLDDSDSGTYVGKNSDGLLEVFARGTDNNIWHNWQTSTTSWSGWGPLQTGISFAGDPTVVANSDGRLEVFARGSDNNIWHIWQTVAGKSWSGWAAIQTGYGFQGTPTAVTDSGGHLEVFARGTDNNIWHNYQLSTGWSGWVNFSNAKYSSNPIAGVNADGLLEVLVRGTDNNMWHKWQTSTTSWSGWGALQTGYGFQGTPAVAKNADGRLEVFARGTDNNMWHNWQTVAGKSWSGWGPLVSGATLTGNPSVGINADGRLEVYARGANNNLYHLWQTTAGTEWSGAWGTLQPNDNFKGTPSAGLDGDGRIEVFVFGGDNNMWHIWQAVAGKSWSGWGALQLNKGFYY